MKIGDQVLVNNYTKRSPCLGFIDKIVRNGKYYVVIIKGEAFPWLLDNNELILLNNPELYISNREKNIFDSLEWGKQNCVVRIFSDDSVGTYHYGDLRETSQEMYRWKIKWK